MQKLIPLIILCACQSLFAQRVGLVLSGGGASGFAHIGVLKALEEKQIPIDYITGTSAGALVGALYASGYSPQEIEAYVLSERFQLMTIGELEKSQQFFFFEENQDASIIEIPFSKDSILLKSLPTSVVTSTLLDFEMMRLLGTAGASVNDNFDNLMVPFRCVASDIRNKKSIVFGTGKLNQVVRASMTYPFYISPIEIDGLLLFDGGLYNNFPLDVMYNEFDTDFIIGSNVTSNAGKPTEDNLISQITNMLVSYSNFSLPCENGYIIQPKANLSTFEFSEVKKAIQEGYQSTLESIDSLYIHINRRITTEELQAKRAAFQKRIPALKINRVNTFNKRGMDVAFVRNSISKNTKMKLLDEKKLTKRYFRTYAFEQVEQLFPTLTLVDSTYILDVFVKKAKEFKVEVGGHFSSRPINTGYIGFNYLAVKRMALKIKAESYFGRFYGSVKTIMDVTIPNYYPVALSPYFVMNRWDYYRSSSTFFEDVKPSFLVQNEIYYGFKVKHPVGNRGKNTFDFRAFDLRDSYYQTSKFTSKDTADLTRFKGINLSWALEFNTLNKKQFANSGMLLNFKFRYIDGQERSISGSTALIPYDSEKHHQWIQFNAEFQTFPIDVKHFHLGLHIKSVMNSQSLFNNYTATILNTTEFAPVPDLLGYFLPEYRAPQHIGFGSNLIFTLRTNLDFRIDGYYYQPFKQLIVFDDGTFGYSKLFKGDSYLFSASLIYNSPIGPMRITTNYFPKQLDPLAFQLSYGFLLFNDRAIR